MVLGWGSLVLGVEFGFYREWGVHFNAIFSWPGPIGHQNTFLTGYCPAFALLCSLDFLFGGAMSEICRKPLRGSSISRIMSFKKLIALLFIGVVLVLGQRETLAQRAVKGASAMAKTFSELKTIPVRQIRRGMVGYGLTVIKGTKPERFRVRVVGILHQSFPKQDLILVLADDPKLKKPGVAAGMSGSPIYFNGQLAGALAYGPTWAKSPVAMVTPIKNMISTGKRTLRGRNKTILAKRYRWGRGDRSALARLGLSYPKLHRLPRPGRLWAAAKIPGGSGGIRPLALPVTVSGVDREGLAMFKKQMKPHGMFPILGGGTSGGAAVKRFGKQKRFVPGGAIGVQYIRGDIAATATGTVTAVVGDRVLAFGHPFWGYGEHYVPVVGAWIHMLMPSVNSSYKISTPLNVMGTLEQDRRPCIVANTKGRAPMIPLSLNLKSKSGGEQEVRGGGV